MVKKTPKRKVKEEVITEAVHVKKESSLEDAVPNTPYPDFTRPYPCEVATVVAALSAVHGVPERSELTMSVLDSLIRTILSQNTTDKTSRIAFASLKEAFPTWSAVLAAPSAEVEDSIRNGGLAEIKTARIKTILSTILQDYPDACSTAGKLARTDGASGDPVPCLEFLRGLPTSQVKSILNR